LPNLSDGVLEVAKKKKKKLVMVSQKQQKITKKGIS
jgi:hypothetical protein